MKEKYTRDGVTISRRYTNPGAVFYTRMRDHGKIRTLHLAETAEKSFAIAIAARRSIRESKFDAFKTATAPRGRPAGHTVAELITAYLSYQGNILRTTMIRNIAQLRLIIIGAGLCTPETWDTATRLDDISDGLLRRWQNTVTKRAYAPGVDAARRHQLFRSANSTMLQARSIFARSRRNDFVDHYRSCGLELPASIAGFTSRPGFNGARKTEYNPPDESIILATLRAIEQLGASRDPKDLNVYLACWTTFGFGLRASAVARTRVGDFVQDEGDIFYRPASVHEGKRADEIGVQLDAWTRLAPHVEGRSKDEYLLSGDQTERRRRVFERLGRMMKALGWETQHHLHELRSWAICRIVRGPSGKEENWKAGRLFAKHAHENTTRTFYGHHLHAKLEKVSFPDLNKNGA